MLKEAPLQPAEPEPNDDPAQLFTQDQLEAYAERLAITYRLSDNPRRGRPLLPRLDESAERLDAAYAFLSTVGRGDTQPVASEQWLRDNHHVVQDQVREIRQDLPRRYYQQLPKLADGPFQGYPRIYVLARELIGHTAGRIDFETITDFVIAYQRSAPLSIG
jgi:cyclic beta-1,2-glucan glucanotransferase